MIWTGSSLKPPVIGPNPTEAPARRATPRNFRPDTRFLDDEIILAEAVKRGGIWCVGSAIASDGLIAIGDDLQQSARPDNGAIGDLHDITRGVAALLAGYPATATTQAESLAIR